MPNQALHAQYRQLPAVETLVQLVETHLDGLSLPRELVVERARAVIHSAREAIGAGQPAPALEQLTLQLQQQITKLLSPSLQPVINATGVILQTNLGRAPLSQMAIAAMQQVGAGYSNLEYDLERGERGSRSAHLHDLLCRLTGAEAALVVNNNAAAIYLVLLALAAGRQVIISRGQAVEIGGGFRIPDVLRQSGARLVEVGTTNRTYPHDYRAAITAETALLMRIHTSNFRLMGFVHETSLHQLVEVGTTAGVPVVDDLGSGSLIPTAPFGLTAEPTVQDSVAAGADIVTFSGDKLLGGPQAGLIVGKTSLIKQLQQHPLARALRVDKTTIAGLTATLLSYLRGKAFDEIPIWQMISIDRYQLEQRAQRLAAQLPTGHTQIVPCHSAIGGGSLPGDTLPSVALAITHPRPDALVTRLRQGQPAVIARVQAGQVWFDLRTVLIDQEATLIQRILSSLQEEL